jgi:molecular chaperone GrpE (heat shock protein)
MSAGTPFASDPLVGERQNEVILAKAILEAALLGDEDAKAWFEANKLRDALELMSVHAAAGGTDQLPVHQAAQERLFQIYDCMEHDEPLGGSPLKGSFLQDIWNNIKKGTADAIMSTVKPDQGANAQAGSSESGTGAGASSDKVGSKVLPTATKGAGASAAQDMTQALSEEIHTAKQALDDAKKSMAQGQEKLSTYREDLRKAALQSARLQWAESLLDVPDDVATILAATTPNMSDVSTFLQSVLSILPAAKETGSTSTLKSLLYAVKAAAQGAGGDGTLFSLLQGDPQSSSADEVVRADAPEWRRALEDRRASQASIAGHAQDLMADGSAGAESVTDEAEEAAPQEVVIATQEVVSPGEGGTAVPGDPDV